ncbi:arsenate-mycothiol transferase ArsC [Alloscardovia sp. HMSC034E08]|uniref:arsenate-mycothiol transferase ArsC n=1 Tax=Alloscardovia sp. HMSC034E08 TaxID=1739413 RepID=UPI0008CC8F51|nr:heat-shock protein HtpX [Alloscardovia sp. HMSC034E08]OFQ97844.1 heat-shock protein HtpX [Alloscardovia sp. HMSC034E08]
MSDSTTILFACRQNAGRSQLAAAFAKRRIDQLGIQNVTVLSAGSEPANQIHPQVVKVLAELGLQPESQPKLLLLQNVKTADWVITMGCGESCPFFPGIYYEDWTIPDPHNQSDEEVRFIARLIQEKVDDLLERVTLNV